MCFAVAFCFFFGSCEAADHLQYSASCATRTAQCPLLRRLGAVRARYWSRLLLVPAGFVCLLEGGGYGEVMSALKGRGSHCDFKEIQKEPFVAVSIRPTLFCPVCCITESFSGKERAVVRPANRTLFMTFMADTRDHLHIAMMGILKVSTRDY